MTEEELAVCVEHGKCGYAAFHRDVILLHQVLILFSLADIHVHYDKIVLEEGRNVLTLESEIEHMAVITPVRAENDEHSLVFLNRFCERFLDFSVRIGLGGVDIF